MVDQTRPMEGCHTEVPRRLRRGRDVRTADDPVAVDARQISTASETVVSWKIHRKSECVTTVVPKLQRLLRPTTRLISRDLQIMDTRTPSLWGADVSSRPGLILRKEVLRQKLRLKSGYATDRDIRDVDGNGRWKSSGRYRHLRRSG